MRVGIVGIQHESNTFIYKPTNFAHFLGDWFAQGEDVRAKYATSHHEAAGFFKGLTDADIEAVPLLMAVAMPSGTIDADAANRLIAIIESELDKAGPLDGILAAPHGAGVSEPYPDFDGHWLSVVRNRVGPNAPIMCTCDPHVNLSQLMVDSCDVTITYRTNPHVDQFARGLEAADLLIRTLRREIRPTQACALPPVAMNIEKQHPSAEPCTSLYALADEIRYRSGVLSVSISLGFPYADVEEMGTGFVVATNNDAALAERYANELADYFVNHRHDFAGTFLEVEDAIDRSLASEQPACLLDMGDNVGGGSVADGTILAHALNRRKGVRSFIAISDPESSKQAHAAGTGARVRMKLGGKTDDRHGEPLDVEVTVRRLHDGKFVEKKNLHGARTGFDMGPTAIVETDAGLVVQLTSVPTYPFSLTQLRCCDVDPASFQILVAKGVNAPIAAYSEVCPTVVRANTPGSTCADMRKLTYTRRRKPLFPLEEL